MMPFVARLTTVLAVVCLLIAGSLPAQSDQDTKDDKKRKRAEARRLLRLVKADFEAAQFDVATVRVDSLLSVDSNNADAYYYKGRIGASIGDTTAAIAALESGSEAAPKSSRIKTYLARLYLVQNRAAEAVEILDQVLAIKPNECAVLYLKGQGLLRVSDTAGALEALQTALQIQLAKGH